MLSTLLRTPLSRRSLARVALLSTLALGAVACGDDDPVETDPAENVRSVRLTFTNPTPATGSPLVIGSSGTGSITLPTGTTGVTVSAQWLDANNQVISGVSTDEFDLRLVGTGGRTWTVNAANRFSGALTGLAAGANSLTVQLFHREEQHEDFAATLSITVQ